MVHVNDTATKYHIYTTNDLAQIVNNRQKAIPQTRFIIHSKKKLKQANIKKKKKQ